MNFCREGIKINNQCTMLALSPAGKFLVKFFSKVGWADSQSNNQRTMFALTQLKSFWFRFFQKANGVKRGRAPKNGAFLFAKLFLLRLLCQKKKRKNDGWYCDGLADNVRTNIFYPSSWAERSGVELFRLRSQTSLRSVCSSLRSEFDCAQDDADEKVPSEARQDLQRSNAHCALHPNTN